MATQIQIRRDTAANWVSANPALALGEFGYETDTGKIKIGDGSTLWNALTYKFDGGGTAGNRHAFTAEGTLANGDKVVLRSDGKVAVVALSGASVSTGTPVVFESDASYFNDCCFDTSNNKVVVIFRDLNNSNYGTAIVGTVSGTSISFGTAVVFASAYTTNTVCCFDDNSNKVVVAYKDTDNSNYGTAIVGTVSGTSISFGTEVVFESALTNHVACCFDSTLNKVVIAYADGGNSSYGTAIVGTVAGTSISFGTAVVFESAVTSVISGCFDSAAGKVVLVYKDGSSDYGTAIVGTVAGTSISFGTAVVFESATVSFSSCCFDSNVGKIIIAYQDTGNSYYGTAIVGTVAGTSISFGTAVVFESANTQAISCAFDSTLNKVGIFYEDYGNSSYGTAILGTVSGTSISFETAVVFESSEIDYINCCFDSTNIKMALVYQDVGNSNYGTAAVSTLTDASSNVDDYIGISESAVTDASATIAMQGSVVTNQTGLTINTDYYVEDDGSLGTDNAQPYVGRAISTTELLLKEIA